MNLRNFFLVFSFFEKWVELCVAGSNRIDFITNPIKIIFERVSHLNFGSSITCIVLKILSKLSSSSNQINCCSVESPCRAPKNDLAFNWTFTLPLASSSSTHARTHKRWRARKGKKRDWNIKKRKETIESNKHAMTWKWAWKCCV